MVISLKGNLGLISKRKTIRIIIKTRTILLDAISYTEYEKITDRDSTKSIFDSLKIIHEGNDQVNGTKALALIQKYEAFKMEDDETIENMFSRI